MYKRRTSGGIAPGVPTLIGDEIFLWGTHTRYVYYERTIEGEIKAPESRLVHSNPGAGCRYLNSCAGPLDLFKMTVAEGGIRSSLLIAGPGIKGGRQVDAFAYVWDIMPTVLDMAGTPHPKKYKGHKIERMRGRPLTGVLTGSAEATYDESDLIGGEILNGKRMRKGDLKAVSVAPPYGEGKWQLYDVVNDPGLKGDTASGGSKPATLSTGAVVKVPLFLSQGQVIRIDTRTGEYVGRGKA